LPDLDGELVTSPSALAPYTQDLGGLVQSNPIAVLYPGSVRDIQEMVKYCRRNDIKVATRGQGHTTFGQSMANGGLVIDIGTLNRIHSIGADGADVEAGATWKTLVQQSVPLGWSPPVLTGYINLSIGGTLSVGGISISNRRGAQVDNVLKLQVVTGRGDVVWCSRTSHPDLFNACLAGLGQCGIITRVVTKLIRTTTSTRNYILEYGDNATYFQDLRTLLGRGEIEDIYTLWFPNGSGGWIYQLNAIHYFNDYEGQPDQNYLLRDLNKASSDAIVQDQSFLDNALKVDVIIDFLESIGQFRELLHPWFDAWLPDEKVESYVGSVLAEATPEDVGPTGFMLMLSQKRSHLTRPNLRVPKNTEWVHLFDILTASATPGPDEAFEARMLQRNRRLFEKARAVGGTRYPIGSLEFDKQDWVRHYGEAWGDLVLNKTRFDPQNILTPGPGIF
jgi:FAD/FMN-containing dehydrogenase